MINRASVNKLSELLNFLDTLKTDDRAKIILSSRNLTFKKFSTFFPTNDLQGIIILRTGKLRFFISSPEGKEISVYYLKANDIDFFIDYEDKFPALLSIGFTAEENSEIIFIPSKVLKLFSNKYPEIEKKLSNLNLEKFSRTLESLQNILFVSVRKRLINFLTTYKKKEINLTHEEIAKILGSSREVISRNLKTLEKEKILKIYRNKIILN